MNRGEVMFDNTPMEVFEHYNDLEKVGLAAPQVIYIMNRLREKGLNVNAQVSTLEEAKAEILKALR